MNIKMLDILVSSLKQQQISASALNSAKVYCANVS